MTEDRLALDFATCFAGAAGSHVISFLRKITKERALPPTSTADELRSLEGQRLLVQQIETLIERGKSGAFLQ